MALAIVSGLRAFRNSGEDRINAELAEEREGQDD
jgi:hypothetical protein